MKFIRPVNSSETDIQIALCNQTLYIKKKALSFYSGNLKHTPFQPKAIRSAFSLQNFISPKEFLKITSESNEIGYVHLSSLSTPTTSTSSNSTGSFSSKFPLKISLLRYSEIKNLSLSKHTILGYTGDLEMTDDSVFPGLRSNKGKVEGEKVRFFSRKGGKVEKLTRVLIDEIDNCKSLSKDDIAILKQSAEDNLTLPQFDRNMFVLVLSEGNLMKKNLGDCEKIVVRRGSVLGSSSGFVGYVKGDNGFDTIRGPCELILGSCNQNVRKSSKLLKTVFAFLLFNLIISLFFAPIFLENIRDVMDEILINRA